MTEEILEDKLVEEIKSGKDISIERALLVVSGLTHETQVEEYVKKIDLLQEGFNAYLRNIQEPPIEESQIAKALFEYLWETKPNRYNSNFFLTDVIDAQLSPDKELKVGNCTGLTSLYTVLGLRNGLNLSTFGNGNGDHILSVLEDNNEEIFIENTSILGFNAPKRMYNNFSKNGLIYLVASIFNERGTAKEDLGNLKGAVSDYDRAIELKPDYAAAFYNRGNAKEGLRYFKGAVSDYDRAIELKPDYAEAFYNRSIAKRGLRDFKGVIGDFIHYVKLTIHR